MNPSIPSVRSLEAFHFVVTLGSVAGAAKQMYVTQPAISHLLRSLDKSTGLVLFEKSGRQLTLSEDGRFFFDEVANGIHVLKELRNAANSIRSAKTGHVRVVSIPVAADHLIPEILTNFLRVNPGIKVSLEVAERHRALMMLESGAVDLALVAEYTSNTFATHVVMQSKAILIVPAAWQEHLPKPITLKSLQEKPFIALSVGSPFRQLLDQYLVEQNLHISVSIQTGTQSAVAALVKNGAGFAIVDESVGRDAVGGIACFPLNPSVSWRYHLLSRQKSSLSTAATLLTTWFANEMENIRSQNPS